MVISSLVLLLIYLWACQHDTQVVIACAEMITSHHLCLNRSVSPITGTCHVMVLWPCGCFSFVWFLFVAWVCFGVFVLLWFFVFGFGSPFLNLERD